MKSTAIYGPPGTGKTTRMMHHISELIERGVEPGKIMYLTFTKAATGEALRRLNLKRSDTVCTIHSACYRLMGMSGASVVNFTKLTKLGELIGVKFRGNADDAKETMEAGDIMLSLHSLARNRLHGYEEEYELSDRPVPFADFKYFVESYDAWKQNNGLVDFTDMLEAYAKDPREHGCEAIFIDESQDLSALQWEVLSLICAEPGVKHIYFAGDDDQAIYEWAGANPHGMIEFEDVHEAERVILDQSYRVPSAVHEVVTWISNCIKDRVPKVYRPRAEVGEVIYEPAFNPDTQKEGFILCRTHSIKQAVERQLIMARKPFLSDGGGLPGPFSCKAAKAIRAWHLYKERGSLTPPMLEAMIASASERVRADLLAGDHTSILKEDPIRIFKMPHIFVDYFRDVDIRINPMLVTSTIHASKGREAPEVTLITDWTGRVAAGMSLNPDAEWRTWYVGASRAKQTLRITSIGEDGVPL